VVKLTSLKHVTLVYLNFRIQTQWCFNDKFPAITLLYTAVQYYYTCRGAIMMACKDVIVGLTSSSYTKWLIISWKLSQWSQNTNTVITQPRQSAPTSISILSRLLEIF